MKISLKLAKIFFILVLLVVSGKQTFAGVDANFNPDASSAQNSCVFDVDLDYLLNPNYDPESAEVTLESPEASFKKTLPLSVNGSSAYARTTILAPLPEKTKSFQFKATLYMSPQDSSQRVNLGQGTSNATCENPSFTAEKELQKSAQTQKTNTLFSAIPQNGGSDIQFGNKSFNIGGIGAALSGCLGVGNFLTSQLGSLFGSGGGESVEVEDSKANQKESCGDSLAYAASRILIQNISKSTINWATSGNNGNPYYPTNYKSLYENIRSSEVSSFISELQSSDSSNPYNTSFARSLAEKYRAQDQSFTEKYKYTGPSASFFEDFKQGGWDSWYKYILEPQNNSLGYSQIASQKIKEAQNSAVQQTREELANNDGFLSQKTCDDKNYIPWSSDSEKSKVEAAAAKGDSTAVNRLDQSVCKSYKVVTPGSLISKQLEEVLGTPIRQAEQVDEINEALGSVFDRMVAKMINKGLNSLSSTDFKKSVDFSFNEPTKNPGYDKLPTGGSFWDQFKTNFDLHRDLPGIIKIQKAYVAQLEKNNEILGLLLKSINNMDYALPGPRVGWADGIEQRIYETVADIKREAQLELGGVLGNLSTLGMRDKILDGLEQVFLKVFSAVFDIYNEKITEKFNPNSVNMPSGSVRMVTMILSRNSYEEAFTRNNEEINKMNDIIPQLEDINNSVIELYKKACARFKRENPGSSCIY